ncbi:MAG: hypothetical protein ACRD52_01955 [Candidatus Acidiferrales bacterium]
MILVRRLVRFALGVAVCGVLAANPAHAQRGAITLPRNLAQLTQQAAVIVRARVLNAHVEPDPDYPSLWTVEVTLRVEEVLKGKAGETLAFREFIWDLHDRADSAGYIRGEDLILLLNPTSSLGLTSPCGLAQGIFRLHRDAHGNLLASNGFGNVGLFRGVAPALGSQGISLNANLSEVISAPQSTPLRLDDLRALIRTFARTQ